MAFLYEKIDFLRDSGHTVDVPEFVCDNLNPLFELRPYQKIAFENFIMYYESKNRPKPLQVLFHMATGSGKTLIMAGLMMYLYKKGYRNFMFFVNLSTIVKKTEDNFLNIDSKKYLFNKEIVIDGERVPIKKVDNFQMTDPNAVNICFMTTQGLHTDMWLLKENGLSFDDFENQKTVLISDEAHHLNVSTKKMSKEEEERHHSWEETVKNIFGRNDENILLEFTATCDLENALIKAEYENKIIYDYQLYKFRADLYSKEIKTLRSDLSIMERALQALMLSQYRLKIFQSNHLTIKPVVLFKAAKIPESKAFMQEFINVVKNLSGQDLESIANAIENPTMERVYAYFRKKGISFDMLANELREDFSEEHCISANDDKEAEEKQVLLNSLEDDTNPYRAIFEVKKLDEGWDVLNLFDIVRLYETRQSGRKKISPVTVSEAQLIGRGARYCPFQLSKEQPKYQRKYDLDLDNELRVCEELYYHCQNDSRYISELHDALREIGIDLDKTVTRHYSLKDDFKKEEIYKSGYIFINDRVIKSRKSVKEILPSIRDEIYTISIATGCSGEDIIMDDHQDGDNDKATKVYIYSTTIGDIARLNYAIINKGLAKYSIFRFNSLKRRFPNLKSTRDFVCNEKYLGNIKVEIKSKYIEPPVSIIASAIEIVLEKIAKYISGIEEEYEGTKAFKAVYIRDVFRDKSINVEIVDGGKGVSQADVSVASSARIDLSSEDWYVFNDNYGTSEEKAFVAYLKEHIEELRKEYDKVFLLRNERQMHLYSFDGGERFEPDYVLFLQNSTEMGFDQLQVFIEPKGTHLVEKDKWKEDFLLQMQNMAVPVKTYVDDNEYHIWGVHFYNRDVRKVEFEADFQQVSNPEHMKEYFKKMYMGKDDCTENA